MVAPPQKFKPSSKPTRFACATKEVNMLAYAFVTRSTQRADSSFSRSVSPRPGDAEENSMISAPSSQSKYGGDACQKSSQISKPTRPYLVSKERTESPQAKKRPSSNRPYVGR